MNNINFEKYFLGLVMLGNDNEINPFPQCLSKYIKDILNLLWFNSYRDDVYENYDEKTMTTILERHNRMKYLCICFCTGKYMNAISFNKQNIWDINMFYSTALGTGTFRFMTNYTDFNVINKKISIKPTQTLYKILTKLDMYLNSEKVKKQIFGKHCNCDLYHYKKIIDDGYCVMNFRCNDISVIKKNTLVQLKSIDIDDVILAIKTAKIKIRFTIENIIIQKLENDMFEYHTNLDIIDIIYK